MDFGYEYMIKKNKLRVILSEIHGNGCFASERVGEGEMIGEYSGEYIDLQEAIRRNTRSAEYYSDYILEVQDNLFIDGAGTESPLCFINHSCEPNCMVHVVGDRAFIVALRAIDNGEEITIDYNYDDDVREICKCGQKDCRGFM